MVNKSYKKVGVDPQKDLRSSFLFHFCYVPLPQYYMAINMHATVNMHQTQCIRFYGYYRQR